MANTTDIVPFGKYRGQPVEVLQQDQGYCEWLMGQDWLQQRYPSLRTIIINNFQEPEETPEHNAMQAQLLDGRFRVALAKLVMRDRFPSTHLETLIDAVPATFEAMGADVVIGTFADACIKGAVVHREKDPDLFAENASRIRLDAKGDIEFLDGQIRRKETALSYASGATRQELEDELDTLRKKRDFKCETVRRLESDDLIYDAEIYATEIGVEIKPAMGDDYPAVIRQIRAMNKRLRRALVLGTYTGSGAKLDQVREMFAASGIAVVLVSEIDELASAI